MEPQSTFINVFVESDLTKSERRINTSWTLSKLKSYFEPISGIPPEHQNITLCSTSNSISTIDQNIVNYLNKPSIPIISSSNNIDPVLSSFPIENHSTLRINDDRGANYLQKEFSLDDDENTIKEKYEMSENSYASREGTVLDWKRKNKLGRFDPSAAERNNKKFEDAFKRINALNIKPGVKCVLLPKNVSLDTPLSNDYIPSPADRRGTIRYVGLVPEIGEATKNKNKSLSSSENTGSDGPWIGVELDNPTGKNDGSINGHRYFTCNESYGSFVRPERIVIGNFPIQIPPEEEEL